MLKEILNKELLDAKIKSLEELYVENVFQEFYIPLCNEALIQENEELKNELSEDDMKMREKVVKENQLKIKSIKGNIQHIEKTIPYLKSLI